MNSIKYIVVFVVSFSINSGINAEMKSTKPNSKNKPEWVHISQPNYLVANGIDFSLEKAKQNAENSLKTLVVKAAVTRMKTKNPYFKQINIEEEVAMELFKKSTYYSEFEANKNYNTHWERLKNKETKSKNYHYYLQHSLNIEKIEKAINEIAIDHKASSDLESIKKQLPFSFRVQEFEKMQTKLKNLSSYFPGNDERKTECENLLSKIEANYENIEIKEMLNVPGKLIVCQTLNNRAIHSSEPPVVKSKSLIINNIENSEEQWIITYKHVTSYKNSSNSISVKFENAGNKRSKDFAIKTNKEKVEIKLTGAPIVIKNKRMIKFYVASSYRSDAVLERIILRYNDLHFTDSRLNQLLDGAGMYTIRYSPPAGFYKIEVGDKVSGELHYKSKITGQKEIFRFYDQRIDESL